jgi:hypothetical protein
MAEIHFTVISWKRERERETCGEGGRDSGKEGGRE